MDFSYHHEFIQSLFEPTLSLASTISSGKKHNLCEEYIILAILNLTSEHLI